MHETMVAESILNTIMEQAKQVDAKPVSAIISCGQFNTLNDEVMSFAFETAAAGTPFPPRRVLRTAVACAKLRLQLRPSPLAGIHPSTWPGALGWRRRRPCRRFRR